MKFIPLTRKRSPKVKEPTAVLNSNVVRIIICLILPAALGCSYPDARTAAPEAGRSDSLSVAHPDNAVAVRCELRYDTIRNEKYLMHCRILRKQAEAKKPIRQTETRNGSGRHFLYPQDIAEFAARLDPSETDVYSQLTNKVVFVILEHEPALLDPGLNTLTHDQAREDYFMYHTAHPLCNTIPADSIRIKITDEMKTSDIRAAQIKKRLLESLAAAGG